MYAMDAPWDTGRPQPAMVDVEMQAFVRGEVLDVGCGTGENALYMAANGHRVLGVDSSPTAIGRAREKAAERGIDAEFEVRDFIEGPELERTFDTVIDVGFFHSLSDQDRITFAVRLHRVIRPDGHYLVECFSERVPGTWGPRRVTQAEIRGTFTAGWRVVGIGAVALETAQDGVRELPAWLAIVARA